MTSIGDEALLLLIIPDIGANGPTRHDGNDDNKENDAIKGRTNWLPIVNIPFLRCCLMTDLADFKACSLDRLEILFRLDE